MDEALKTGDPAFITRSLGAVARARGMTRVGQEAVMSRETLYRALGETGNGVRHGGSRDAGDGTTAWSPGYGVRPRQSQSIDDTVTENDFSGGMVRDIPQINKMISDNTALGRVGGPEDVGPVIAGLLSNEMGWVNAQRIEVAGGVHI